MSYRAWFAEIISPAACFLSREIRNAATRKRAVRNDHILVVAGFQDRVENLNLFHRTGITLRIDEITDLERLEEQNQHAAGKVCKTALKL